MLSVASQYSLPLQASLSQEGRPLSNAPLGAMIALTPHGQLFTHPNDSLTIHGKGGARAQNDSGSVPLLI